MIDPENLDAMQNLERLYRSGEQWFDLVDILQQHIEVVDDEQRVDLLNELARIQRDNLEDAYAAIESFESSLEVDGQQPNVLFDVAELHESTSNWEQAIDAYRRLVDYLEDPVDQVDVLFTIGEIYESELADGQRAAQALQEALDIDPTHTPSREAIEEIYARRGQWEELIDVYLDAVEATDDLDRRADFLARIGGVYEEQLEDDANALNYYEQALEEDPHELSAAEPLIGLYLDRDAWERAVPLLEMVIERYRESEDPHREELQKLHGQLARVYEGLQQDEKALEEYRRAFEMDARNVDVLMGLGRLLHQQGELREAGRMLQQVEDDHLAGLDDEELQELYVMLGEIRREEGNNEEAIDALERVVDYDPDHSEALESLAKLYQQTERWEQAIDVTRQLLDADDDDPAMRFTRWTRIGDMCADHTDNPNRAIEAYQSALEAKPGSVAVLRKLLEIYKSTEQWHAAVDVLSQLVDLQDDKTRRAKFLYTTAIIQRDKMNDVESALETFEAALDEDLERLEAFEAIDRIYTRRKDWKGLERAYRRMLRRIAETGGGRDEIKFKLWEGLGEIYRSRLGHPKSAIKAFETAAQLQPSNERIRLILADLYEKTGENLEGAIEQHRKMLQNDPFRIESYKALFSSYLQSEEYDRAWCMAAALDFLQEADEKEQAYFEKYRTQNLRRADKFFDQEAWDLLYHEDQNMLISHIMSILSQGLRQHYADELKRWDLHSRKDKLDLDQGTLFANVFTYAAETTGIAPVPNVYLKTDQAFGIRNANVQPPAIVAGADVVQNRPARELAFRLGKLLASMRSEHYLGSLSYPTEFLKMLFMAAMHVTNDSLGLESKLGESGMLWVEEIQNMPSQMQLQLRQNVSQYLKTGENPNLSVWLKHVEYTTNRVGLTLCGDLKEAAQIVKTDRNQTISKASTREKIEELILFSISDEYSELRRKLGLAID
jgi:tetratricopeptide (TPR) repeat protein